ncbi:MAG TPA: site-2 protease family protein [Firmicutes bacterium]|nr:site-2 protease family protein [Bacillota bacterium]
MLLDLLYSRGSFSLETLFFTFLSYAMVILLALPVHELAHGYVADRMGDHTARWNGRLTMNPFAHLDLMGTLMIFLFGFGYAKPVPVNPRNFRNYKTGMALTALAGPASNLLMAFLSLLILRLFYLFLPAGLALNIAYIFFRRFALINVSLAVFNLLPIPPLDGFRIVANVLPPKWSYFVDRYQMYITLVVMALAFSGVLSWPISRISAGIFNFFVTILMFH